MNPQKIAKKSMTVNYPENFPVVYSNFANFTIAAFDVSIDFGVRHDGPNGSVVQMNSRLIMSPQHAKVFVEKLKGLIENYEKNIGKIPIPKADR